MASMKAKKGNPFEKDVAYNLSQIGYDVTILGDNYKGVDIIAKNGCVLLVECKNRQKFSFNEIDKYHIKIVKSDLFKQYEDRHVVGLVIFKPLRTPVLVYDGRGIFPFDIYFQRNFNKRPKGWRYYGAEANSNGDNQKV